MKKRKVQVAVTGAAGQISYSLLFRLASGEVFGPDCQVVLRLLELPHSMKALEGVAMELQDCAFRTLASVECYDSPRRAFEGVNWALLVGASPRGPGMERNDLIRNNGPIFLDQGKALSYASSDVHVVVLGNPCNTNALIALHHCRDIDALHFSAMTALDENRAKAQLAKRAGVSTADVTNLTIWGNHSSTMFPDFENTKICHQPIESFISDRKWLENDFINLVQQRGAAVIKARGRSSAASAASACVDHIKKFLTKTPDGDWFSAAVPSNGSLYDIPKGLVFSLPVRADGMGGYQVVNDISLSSFAKAKIVQTSQELMREKEVVADLLVSNR